MPAKSKSSKRPASKTQHKRQGSHHRHSKQYVKVYWPYVPMLLIVLVGLFFGSNTRYIPGNVLAYATEMSNSQLLSATNDQRSANGKSSLSINSRLSAAAQAKANDMAARNYWSHNTPEGSPPWVFIDAQGYGYKKAGENLAYGFSTSSATITGWMNSASHRANMLDGSYTEVGFGFTNATSYNNSGQQTIVVAMYGQPQVASASTPAPQQAPTQQKPQPRTNGSHKTSPAPEQNQQPESTVPAEQDKDIEAGAVIVQDDTITPAGGITLPVNSSTLAGTEPLTQRVSRLDLLANNAPIIALFIGLTSVMALAFVTLKHSLVFKRVLIHGEQFILKHPLLDIALVGLVMVTYVFNQTGGFIK